MNKLKKSLPARLKKLIENLIEAAKASVSYTHLTLPPTPWV